VELYNIDSSKELAENCGLEASLYIMFIKYSAWFFAFVSVLTCSVLLPAYWTGTSTGVQSPHHRFTLLNAIYDVNIHFYVFVVTVAIGVSGHVFVYMYRTNAEDWTHKY
jgi:hypothetical protein